MLEHSDRGDLVEGSIQRGIFDQLDRGAICQPKGLQKPHIPFWIAGGGEQITLKIAARYAQYTNFGGDDLAVFENKSKVLADHCADVGTNYDSIVRSANFNILCGDTEESVAEKKVWYHDHLSKYVSAKGADRFAALFEPTSGTPEQIVARLKEFEAAGLGYVIVQFADIAYDRESVELFASEVIPAFA